MTCILIYQLGCLCDLNFEGYDCSRRSCPASNDSLTTAQNPEVVKVLLKITNVTGCIASLMLVCITNDSVYFVHHQMCLCQWTSSCELTHPLALSLQLECDCGDVCSGTFKLRFKVNKDIHQLSGLIEVQ